MFDNNYNYLYFQPSILYIFHIWKTLDQENYIVTKCFMYIVNLNVLPKRKELLLWYDALMHFRSWEFYARISCKNIWQDVNGKLAFSYFAKSIGKKRKRQSL